MGTFLPFFMSILSVLAVINCRIGQKHELQVNEKKMMMKLKIDNFGHRGSLCPMQYE